MITKTVVVTHDVRVIVDETKFTEEFMQEFRDSFYDFDTIDEHIIHLGSMYLRGLCNQYNFIEGYGNPLEMGIKFEDGFIEESIVDE